MRVPLIAADDLIATKLLASRPKDLDDVRSLRALGAQLALDRDRLHATVAMLEGALSASDLAPLLARLEAEHAPAMTRTVRTTKPKAARTKKATGSPPRRTR